MEPVRVEVRVRDGRGQAKSVRQKPAAYFEGINKMKDPSEKKTDSTKTFSAGKRRKKKSPEEIV